MFNTAEPVSSLTSNKCSRQPLHPAISLALKLVFMATTLSAVTAYADDYADVNRLAKAGQLTEALAKADQYLIAKPRDPQMRFIKGVVQTEAGKPADAILTFTRITEDYPELPEPYNNLAVLYAGQSQFDKARAALEMAIRTNPSYATAHENLGDVYAKLASQAYTKALQLDGSNAAVQPKLALIRTLFAPDAAGQKAAAAAPAAAVATSLAAAPAAPAAKTAPAPASVASQPAAAVVAPPPKPAATQAMTPPAKPAVVATASTGAAPVAATANTISSDQKSVEAAVQAWAEAWTNKDMATYLSSYGPKFNPPGKQSRAAWEVERRARIVGKSRIDVKVSNIDVNIKGTTATARFKQDYSGDSLTVSGRKTLDLVKTGERWFIVKESTGG